MDLRQLGYFVAIGETRSFTAAARACNISQSALSRQVQLLEEELGVELLERHAKGVRLTRAGIHVAERANRLLAEAVSLKKEAREFSSEPSGVVTLALPPTVRQLIAAGLITAYAERYPHVDLVVRELLSREVAQSIAAGHSDVGVCLVDDASDFGLTAVELTREPLVVIGSANSDLDMRQAVSLIDVANRSILIWKGSRLFDTLQKAAGRARFELRTFAAVESIATALDLASQGHGLVIAPFSASLIAFEAGMVKMAPLNGFSTGWSMAWSNSGNLSAAGVKLTHLLKEGFARLDIPSRLDRYLEGP